jgi:hypothetical protein
MEKIDNQLAQLCFVLGSYRMPTFAVVIRKITGLANRDSKRQIFDL